MITKPTSMFDGLAKASGLEDEEIKQQNTGLNESIVSEDLDQTSEHKNASKIPSIDQTNKKGGRFPATASKIESFSQRIQNGKIKVDSNDQQAIANHMLYEINMMAGRLLILQF